MKWLLLIVILTLSSLVFSQSLKCTDYFFKQQKIEASFLKIFPNKKKIDKIINLATDFQSDGSVSIVYAKSYIEKLYQNIVELNIPVELVTPYLTNFQKELKEELEIEIKRSSEGNSKILRYDFFNLYKLSRKSAYLFQFSESSFEGYLKIYRRGQTDNTDKLRTAFIKNLLKMSRFNETIVNANVEDLKLTIKNNPSVKLHLTFEPVDKLEIYKLLRHRIFLLGMSTVPVFADENVLFQENFLVHDESHLYAFLEGTSANGALFKPINVKEDSYDKEIAWQNLEKKFQLLEEKLTKHLAEGKIKNPKVIEAVLFDLYHEAFEPIHKKLKRSSENSLSLKQSVLELFNSRKNITEDLDTIIEIVNSIFI